MTALRALLATFLLALGLAGPASGHALEPGYLELRQIAPESWRAFWRKPDVNGRPMEIGVALPDSCTPDGPPPPTSDGYAWVSTWVAECREGLAGQPVAIPGLAAQNTDVLVRVIPLEGRGATLRMTPSQPEQIIPVDPSTAEVLASYTLLGWEHILEGWDHLLFVFALLLLVRDGWRLVGAITAFTLAHSITLALATLGHLSIPGPPVEATIALSIVFLAVEILKHEDGTLRLSERFPWLVSFSFGLLHGLGFAGALTEIGLPEGDIPAALLAFNVGVELGQLTFVAGVLALVWIGRRLLPSAGDALRAGRTPGTLALGYCIGGMATFWLVERVAGF